MRAYGHINTVNNQYKYNMLMDIVQTIGKRNITICDILYIYVA